MLSADNNDETTKNMWHAYAESGMPRTWGLHWNAVPWFVGTEKKNAGVTGDQVGLGNTRARQARSAVNAAFAEALATVGRMGTG